MSPTENEGPGQAASMLPVRFHRRIDRHISLLLDLLAFHMQRHGVEFAEACKSLGCWVGNDKAGSKYIQKPLPFSARAGLEVVRFECLLIAMAACNVAKGVEHTTKERKRLVEAVARIEFIAAEIAR